MTEPRSHGICHGDAVIHVIDEGPPAAPCVVLAHSIMTDHRMWDGQVRTLRSLGLRVLRYDNRGHGDSSPPHAPCPMRVLGNDVVAILDRLGIARSHFVGLSLGGIIGFDLAANHPDRLLSLIVADARADATPEYAAPWDERVATARAQGMQGLVDTTMARWFGPSFAERDPGSAEAIRVMIRRTTVAGFAALAKVLQDFDYRGAITGIGLPATLVVGARDGALPGAMADLATCMRSRLEVVPEAGHLPNFECPEAFNAVLHRHFATKA